MKARKSLYRFIALLALLLALSLTLPAVAEEAEFSLEGLDVEEVTMDTPLISSPLPIDFTGGYAPQEQYYLDDNTYQDPTISVQITEKDIIGYAEGYSSKSRHATAWIVDVRIGHASQLRTAPAESFDPNAGGTMPLEDIASRVNAVVAFNADYFTGHLTDNYVFRERILFLDKLRGKNWDVLLIDEDGDFHPFHIPDRNTLPQEIDGKKIDNAFCFGPILVENGEICEKMPESTYLKPKDYFARIALCQVGPLHYKVILTTHLQSQAVGLPLKAFAQLCKDEGAITAYNLDGGMSTSLYFRGNRVNKQYKVTFRDLSDIFYFASSWNGGNEE